MWAQSLYRPHRVSYTNLVCIKRPRCTLTRANHVSDWYRRLQINGGTAALIFSVTFVWHHNFKSVKVYQIGHMVSSGKRGEAGVFHVTRYILCIEAKSVLWFVSKIVFNCIELEQFGLYLMSFVLTKAEQLLVLIINIKLKVLNLN